MCFNVVCPLGCCLSFSLWLRARSLADPTNQPTLSSIFSLCMCVALTRTYSPTHPLTSHQPPTPPTPPPGINVVSRIRCYGLFWTLNPLRKVLCHEKPWGKHGSVAAVAVSTLQGHLLEGASERASERWPLCRCVCRGRDAPRPTDRPPPYPYQPQGKSASASCTKGGGTAKSGSTCSPSPRAASPSAASCPP